MQVSVCEDFMGMLECPCVNTINPLKKIVVKSYATTHKYIYMYTYMCMWVHQGLHLHTLWYKSCLVSF